MDAEDRHNADQWAWMTDVVTRAFESHKLPAPKLIGPDGLDGACQCGAFVCAFVVFETSIWVAVPCITPVRDRGRNRGRIDIRRIFKDAQLHAYVDEVVSTGGEGIDTATLKAVYDTLSAAWPRA